MKTIIYSISLALLSIVFSVQLNAQVKIGSGGPVVQPSAVLQLESADKGLLLPRLTDTTAINNLNPPDGMMIYLVPDNSIRIRTNGSWKKVNTENSTTLVSLTDYTNSSSNVSNATSVPELNFTAEANKEYIIDAHLLVRSANTGNGIKIALSGPASGVQFAALEIMVPKDQGSQTVANVSAFNTYAAGTKMPGTAQTYLARIQGVFKMGASPGTVGVKFYTETNGTIVTIKAGSVLQYRGL